jgi:general secretion pathway protein G
MPRRPSPAHAISRRKGLVIGREKGFSLLELAVVAIVVGIVFAVLMHRIQIVQEAAEKTSVETMIIRMRMILQYRVGQMRIQLREARLPELIGSNPVDLMETPPPGYVGVLSGPDVNAVPAGSWYFDKLSGELRYKPLRSRHFSMAPGERSEIRLRIASTYRDDKAKTLNRPLEGIRLTLVSPYTWFSEDIVHTLP